jgi:mannosyltransferase
MANARQLAAGRAVPTDPQESRPGAPVTEGAKGTPCPCREANIMQQGSLGRQVPVGMLVGLGLLLATAFALRTFQLTTQDVWWDEARNVFTASRPLAEIGSAPELDVHPPLYFVLLHLWTMLVGTGEFAIRFFSVWFGVATVALLFRLGRLAGDHHVGWWAAFLAALSPLLVDEAQQTRMYTLVLFLSALSFYFLWRAIRTRALGDWLVYAALATASLYVHYSFVYILAAQNVYLAAETVGLWRRGAFPRQIVVNWTASQLTVAVCYLFQVPNILRQLGIYGNPGMTPPTLDQYARDLIQAFLVGQDTIFWTANLSTIAIVTALTLGLVGLLRSPQNGLTLKGAGLALIWLAVPICAYFAVTRLSPQFTPRYAMVAVLPLYVLLAFALAAFARQSARRGIVIGALLIIAFAGAWQSHYFNPDSYSEDTHGLATFIEEKANQNDVVFVDTPFAFQYYYHGTAPAHYLFVDVQSTAEVLTRLAAGKNRLFWITWYKSDTDPRAYVSFLLDKYAIRLGEELFRGYDVVWYQLPTDARFSLAEESIPTRALFGDQLALTGFALGGTATSLAPNPNERRVASDGKAWVVLWWNPAKSMTAEYKVSVVLRDDRGGVVAQDDRRLLNDRHLGSQFWLPGETVINVYMLELKPQTNPGVYTASVIVYDPVTGQRLAVGAGDSFALGSITVLPASRQ